jgi:uncharacterized protein
MKKDLVLIATAIIISVLGILVVQSFGYDHIEVADGKLYGKTMFVNKEAIVLIVAGSGPTDMDGNTPLINGRNDSLLQIATSLKKEGISSLRYDKRTTGKSADSFDNSEIDFNMLVADCVAWIQYVKSQGYEKVYVAGHSQGSLIAMLAATQEDVDGVISLAGAGLFIDQTLERQLTQKLGVEDNRDNIEILSDLRKGVINEDLEGTDSMFTPANQRFLLSWMKYDPAKVIQSLDCPVLILQGSEDLQVDLSEYNALTNASPNSQALMIEGMNHVLKPVRDEKHNIAAYSDPSLMVDQRLVDSIVNFILN